MTDITASMVKELRERSGAGMMDCKKALGETKGNIEEAIDFLRKKGIIKAGSKSSRVAAEGLIGLIAEGKSGAIVEVNAETDFVARNDKFQDMVRKIASVAPQAKGDVAKLVAMKYPGGALTIEETVKEMIATIGENMNTRRTAVVAVTDGVVSDYLHNKVADGLGKIGVLVALESKGDKPKLFELGKQIAMHIAASPTLIALDIAGVPADVLAREKAILAEKNQGKKPEVLEKIFQSSLKSFAKEHCLLDQVFVIDPSKSVGQALKDAEGRVGAPVAIASYIRYALGEGIEKATEDFAEEVKKAGGA
jgi:elongation factor Ts